MVLMYHTLLSCLSLSPSLSLQVDVSAAFAYVSAPKDDKEIEVIKVRRVLYYHFQHMGSMGWFLCSLN